MHAVTTINKKGGYWVDREQGKIFGRIWREEREEKSVGIMFLKIKAKNVRKIKINSDSNKTFDKFFQESIFQKPWC